MPSPQSQHETVPQHETVKVDLGGRSVTVPKGGLYDRYRRDTDLDAVARDPRVSGVDFFRKHDGYGFPKWVTGLDVDIDAHRTTARVADDAGGVDLALSAPTPAQHSFPSGKRVASLTSYTAIDGAWHSTLSQTNVLSAGTAFVPRDLQLTV